MDHARAVEKDINGADFFGIGKDRGGLQHVQHLRLDAGDVGQLSHKF